MKYQFIKENRLSYPVVKMSKVLNVSPSGFYSWQKRPKSNRAIVKEKLQKAISEKFNSHGGVGGSPVITEDLREHSEWKNISQSRVGYEMRGMKLRSKTKKRFKVTTDSSHKEPVAPNLLERKFSQPAPNMVWVTDITYLPVGRSWAYLAVFIDLFSRKVVGWDLSDSLERSSVIKALDKAFWSRKPENGLIIHSDRGVQYASKEFRERLKNYGSIQSMSRKGNCWDNAVAESFFSSLKMRLTKHRNYEKMEELQRDLFWYIEVYYNRFRKHSTNNWVTPEKKELNYYKPVLTDCAI
jgi:putative transposase